MAVRWHFLIFLLVIDTYRSHGKHIDNMPDNEGLSKKVNTINLPNSEALSNEGNDPGVIPDEERSSEESSYWVQKSSGKTTNLTATKITNTEGITNELSNNPFSSTQVPDIEVPTSEVPPNEISTSEVPPNEISTSEVPPNENLTSEVPPNEMSTSEVPLKITAEVPSTEAPNLQTVRGHMTVLISDSKEVCNRIRNINIYENLVIATLPLRESPSYHTRINNYTEVYNRDLERIQDHKNILRKDNNVVAEIRSIYGLAKRFEDEFNRKLEICRERILNTPELSQKLRETLEIEINHLKKEKEHLKSKLQSAHQYIKPYIEEQIGEKNLELQEKIKEKRNSTPLGLALNELVFFLGFARDNAIIVKDKTPSVAKRLETLYNTIKNDNDTSLQYNANITSDLASLMHEKSELEDILALKNTTLHDFEKTQENLENDKSKIKRDNDDLMEKLKNISSQSKNITIIFDRKKKSICRSSSPWMKEQPPSNWTATRCDFALFLSGHSLIKDLKVLEEPRNRTFTKLKLNTDKEKEIHLKLSNITYEKNKVTDEMSEIRARIRQIQTELSLFNMFKSDVDSLISGIKTVMPYISETRGGVLIVETTFEFLIEHIGDIIDQAESATREEERQKTKEAVDEAINLLKEQLSDSSKMMSDVYQCSM